MGVGSAGPAAPHTSSLQHMDVKPPPPVLHPQQQQTQAPYQPVAPIPQMQPSPQLQPPGYPVLAPTPRKRQRAGERPVHGLSPASSSGVRVLREPQTHPQGPPPLLGPSLGTPGPPNMYSAPRHEYGPFSTLPGVNEYGGTNNILHTEHPQHHHHRLPEVHTTPLGDRSDLDPTDMLYTGAAIEHRCMVGVEGFPPPALAPVLPKSKFTSEDDELLKHLKDEKKLSWKQIADFFPKRTSGTLQVRYCTKLRKKKEAWDPDSDQKLKDAIASYERERWKTVALRVGSGFTKEDCEARAVQLEVEARATQQASQTHSAVQRQRSHSEMVDSEGGDADERHDAEGMETNMHQQHPLARSAAVHGMLQEQQTQGYQGQWHAHAHGGRAQADVSRSAATSGPNGEW